MNRVSANQDTNQDLRKLGASIRARRLEMRLSQEALADMAGIDRSHMGKIERGERNVTFLNIAKISHALELVPSQLLDQAGL